MKSKRLLALCVCIAVVCVTFMGPMTVNASAPAGWRNLQDFYVFKDTVNGWSGSGAGELETVNGNLPVDTQVTYENLPSLRLNLQTQLTSYWMSVILVMAGWCNHDVSQYVPNGYLEFNVKGKNGGEQFVIGAVDHVSERASGVEKTITKPITDYCTVTTNWQHVKIPLKDILDPSLGIDPYNAKAIVLDKVTLDPFCVWINQLKITSPDKEKAFPAIKLNQVGFLESSEKYAYVSGFEDEFTAAAGTQFQVKRVSDDAVVYSGQLSLFKDYDATDSGERILKAVFTDFKQPGEYYITVNASGIDKSPKFKIGNDVFKPLLTDVARYFYYQRSGTALTSPYCPDYPRADRSPLDAAAIFDSNPAVTRDVSKGWFDAGDLGKYVSTGSGTLINLFWAYELYPGVYSDNQFNIPESGNGVPDILDEARWELEWILKMQDAGSGGFYARVQSDDDGNITKRIIKDKEGSVTNIRPTDDTAWAAAALAHASMVYANYDSAFALQCLNAAKSAWTYLEQNPTNIKSPSGPYNTDNDSAERLLAAASLYRATGEAKYNNYFVANYTNGKSYYENASGDWVGSWNFAFFSYMKANNRSSDAENWFKNEFAIWVNNKTDRYLNNPWGNTIYNGNYYWGSNSQILGMSMEAVIGSKLLGTTTDTINNMALSSLNWILGANPMRKSFVTGYGEDCVKTVFSTFNNDGKSGVAKGFMPLGPNRYEGAGLSIFPAKCYLDSADEWTTNEHAVGSTSILEFITAFANGISTSTPSPTPTPTPSATNTATPTPTASATNTATPTPTSTPTPSATNTVTPTPTATPTPTPSTATPTPTPSTATPTPTPSTATPTPTPSTATPTPTPTPSTATPTPTPTAGTPIPGGIKVQFFNGNTAATSNTLYTNFKLVNTGTTAITLSNVKVRYYFTNDGTQANSFACDYSTIGAGNVTGSFTTIAKTNADRYLEVGFTSGAGTLAAGASSEVKCRIWKSDWSNFTQTNDYSFNSTATNYVDSSTVTGYLAGTLKWGTEP